MKEGGANVSEYEEGELMSIELDPKYPERKMRIGQRMDPDT